MVLPNQHQWVKGCLEYYEEQGFYPGDGARWELAHYPIPRHMGGKETVHLLWEHHQIHGLLQSLDVNARCFFNGSVNLFLNNNFLRSNWMDLQDLYERFRSLGREVPCKVYDHETGEWIHGESMKQLSLALGLSKDAVKDLYNRDDVHCLRGRYTLTPLISPRKNTGRQKKCRIYDHQAGQWIEAESRAKMGEAIGCRSNGNITNLFTGQYQSLKGRYTLCPAIQPLRNPI